MGRKTAAACPQCGSLNIEYPRWYNPNAEVVGSDTEQDYYCNACSETFRVARLRDPEPEEVRTRLSIDISLDHDAFEEDLPGEIRRIFASISERGLDAIHDGGVFEIRGVDGAYLGQAQLITSYESEQKR